MSDWNPDLYLQFEEESNQPIRELLSKLQGNAPSRILDVGCGRGNSARLLFEQWPMATIVGIDKSSSTLKEAEREFPGGLWVQRDAGDDLSDLGHFELVFSNTALHWIPDHDALLPNLFSRLEEGGSLAVQVPNNGESLVVAAVREVVASRTWSSRLRAAYPRVRYHGPDEFYDRLCWLCREPIIWETRYYHVMNSLNDMTRWLRGIFLKNYFDQMPDAETSNAFEADILSAIKERVARRANGKYLIPFRRLFFIATNNP